MERRHYIEVLAADLSGVTSFSRKMNVDGETVEGYTVNGTDYDFDPADYYTLLVTLPVTQPYSGVIAHTDIIDTWTNDGLYMHNSGIEGTSTYNGVYIKDFLEDVPESYHGLMINNLTSGDLDIRAGYLLNNRTPKEFKILVPQQGIQDQIVAYENNTYYINSSNDYVPYRNTDDEYGADWAIPDTVYDPVAKTNGLISDGIRKDMVLKSEKLIYMVTFDGLTTGDINKYMENSTLIHLNNVEIDLVAYQVYYNANYIYDINGSIPQLVQSTWQTITIANIFEDANLQGKVLKVW